MRAKNNKNRGGPGLVVKCNGFPWISFARSARACLRRISLTCRMCSAALLATTWGLHDAKWRCSKNAFREEPDYLADCTVRDAMVVPPCFRLFASAPPPDRKAAPMHALCAEVRCLPPAAVLPMLLMKKHMHLSHAQHAMLHVFARSTCNVGCVGS